MFCDSAFCQKIISHIYILHVKVMLWDKIVCFRVKWTVSRSWAPTLFGQKRVHVLLETALWSEAMKAQQNNNSCKNSWRGDKRSPLHTSEPSADIWGTSSAWRSEVNRCSAQLTETRLYHAGKVKRSSLMYLYVPYTQYVLIIKKPWPACFSKLKLSAKLKRKETKISS